MDATSAASLRLDDVTGIVLAGGRSTRFGSDKLAVEIDGRPILHRAIAAVAAVAARVVVVAAPGVEPAIPVEFEGRVRVIHDPESFGGPLVGLAAALDAVETPVAIVVGGDMPRLVPSVLHRLAVTVGIRHAAVTLEVPGRIQPLPMAVDVASARAAATLVRGRDGSSLRELLGHLRAISVPAPVWLALDPAGSTIADIDRPGDLDG